MKKIGDITNTADKNGEFTNGNVAAGTPPTTLEAPWFNSVQREILNVLLKANIAQNPEQEDQLAKAIQALASTAVSGKIKQTTGASTTDIMSQKVVTDELGKKQNSGDFATNTALKDGLDKKLDKTGVVQVTGTSATQVMSQGAITKVLNQKLNVGQYGWGGEGERVDLDNDAIKSKYYVPTDVPSQIWRNWKETDFSYALGTVAYFRTGDIYFSLTASPSGEGVRAVAGKAGNYHIYDVLTNKNTINDESGYLMKAGAKSMIVQEKGTSTTKVMSQKAVTELTGANAKWKDVTGNRSLGAKYTNSTGRTIYIYVAFYGYSAVSTRIFIDELEFGGSYASSSGTSFSAVIAPIPAGSSYYATAEKLTIWREM